MKGRKGSLTFTFKDGSKMTKAVSDKLPEPPPEGADDAAVEAYHYRLLHWRQLQADLAELDEQAADARRRADAGRGGGSEKRRRDTDDRHEDWIERARQISVHNPSRSGIEVARHIAEEEDGVKPDTIARIIRPALKSR